MSVVPSFNVHQFQRKVTEALEHVQRILTTQRYGQLVRAWNDQTGCWSDKFGLAECLSNTTIAALLTAFEQLELNPERLSVAWGWKNNNNQSVSLRLYSQETCRLIRQADRKVEGDEFIYENAFVTHTSTTITTIHEWFWDFQVSYRLVFFAGADSNAEDARIVLFDRQRSTQIITRTETPPHPSEAVATDQTLNITPLIDLLRDTQHQRGGEGGEGEEEEHQLAVAFAINSEESACRTPRRNPATESLLDFLNDVRAFFQVVSSLCARMNGREVTIFVAPAPRMNEEIPVGCHDHPLKRAKGDDGWRCDGHRNPGACRSGITDFHQTAGVERFRCQACDFDLCLKCLNANRTDFRSPQPFPSRMSGTVFLPIVPLFDKAPSSSSSSSSSSSASGRKLVVLPKFEPPVLSRDVIYLFLDEHRESLLRGIEATACLYRSATRLVGPDEAKLAVVAEHVGDLIVQHSHAIEEIEARLYAQLAAAIGKMLQPTDFEEFMRWHNQKFFLTKYRLAPFAFAVRRPGHSPEGTISIERCGLPSGGGGGTPIYTSLRSSLDNNAAMGFAINAATQVSFGGERHVHAWTTHQFDGVAPSIQLVARARQFSSYILLVGKIGGAKLFLPTGATIVQNKGEVTVPLELEPMPTPKEFRDAIVSLSPDQQAFCKAFRAMQLESSQFAVCVIDLKPSLETLLKLPLGSLTKEIQLAQDLQTLFIEFQIPSDLLTYDGPCDAPCAAKIDVVKGYVAAVQAMIAEENRRIQEEAERKRLAEELRRKAEEEQRRREEEERMRYREMEEREVMRSRECEEVKRESAPRRRMLSSGKPAPKPTVLAASPRRGPAPMANYSAGPKPSLASAPAPVRQSTTAPPPPPPSSAPAPVPNTAPAPSPVTAPAPTPVTAPDSVAPAASNPTPSTTTQTEGEQHAGRSHEVSRQAEVEGEDYTQIPAELDARFLELDADNCLRTTTVKPSMQWTKKAQATLLGRLTTTTLNKDGIKTEQNQAFDLLDFLSRSGSITLEYASLHVFMAATHCFDRSLIDSLVLDNINPIDKLERSLLIMASTVQKKPAAELIKPQHLARVSATHPQLFD